MGWRKFSLHFFISVQWLTRGMDHIFTVNKEDAIVPRSPSPIAPHISMHNESDPLCQHRSLLADKKVKVCSLICYKMQETCESTRRILATFPPLLRCIQAIAGSLLKSFFALPVLSSYILFILLKSVSFCWNLCTPSPRINSVTHFSSLVSALATPCLPKEATALLM